MIFGSINTLLMNLVLACNSAADGGEIDEFEHFPCTLQGGSVTCCLNIWALPRPGLKSSPVITH